MYSCISLRSYFCLWVYDMPPTTTSTPWSHCTVYFCVHIFLMLLSGYHCQDICVNDPDRVQCITDLNNIETGHENTGENCIKIEGKYSSPVYMYIFVCMQCTFVCACNVHVCVHAMYMCVCMQYTCVCVHATYMYMYIVCIQYV